MRSYLILLPLAALLTACGSQGTYRDFDGSYSWTNTQAYREGYQSGFDRGYQEGIEDQDMDDRGAESMNRAGRTRTIVRYEYYPTYYNNWSQPWMHPYGYGAGWNQPNRWNRRNHWNNYWNDPWGYGGGNYWNDPWGFGGGNYWNDPWGWNSPWGNGGYYYGYGGYSGYGGYGGYGGNGCFGCFGGYNRWNNQGWGGIQPSGGSGGSAEPTPDDGLRRQQIQSGLVPYRRPVLVNNLNGGRLESKDTREALQTRQESSSGEGLVERPGSISVPQQTQSSGQTRPTSRGLQSTSQPVPQREVRPAAPQERRPASNTTSPSRSGGSAPSMQQQRPPSNSSPQRGGSVTRRPL